MPPAEPPPSPPELDAPAQARLAACLAQVRGRMRAAEAAAGRPEGAVQLLAVTKTFGPAVVAAAARLGQQRFGENYAQEAVAKMTALQSYPDLPALEWHFIGPIQSNKTRLIATYFDWVQSVDRSAIAERLAAQRPPGRPPLQVLVEVNISGEASKSGVDPGQLPALALVVAGLPQLRLRGLMAIPQPGLDTAGQRAAFGRLRALLDEVRTVVRDALSATMHDPVDDAVSATVHAAAFGVTHVAPDRDPAPARGAGAAAIDTLSIGMSADFEAAIAQGSTMVRVGSAIFGERT